MVISERISVNCCDESVANYFAGIVNILIFQQTAGLPDLADICS